MAKGSEIALHKSMSGWILGSAVSLRKRRSNASDAQRYWVGFNPILEKARRQAWISGNSPSDVRTRRDSAIAEYFAICASTEASFLIAAAKITPGTRAGWSRQISDECRKYIVRLAALSAKRQPQRHDAGRAERHRGDERQARRGERRQRGCDRLGPSCREHHRGDDGDQNGRRNRVERGSCRRARRVAPMYEQAGDSRRIGRQRHRDDRDQRRGLDRERSGHPFPHSAPAATCQGGPKARYAAAEAIALAATVTAVERPFQKPATRPTNSAVKAKSAPIRLGSPRKAPPIAPSVVQRPQLAQKTTPIAR